MIARDQTPNECEQIYDLLLPYADMPGVRRVLQDAQEVSRLLALYSFRPPQLADRLYDMLWERYRYEIYALYGGHALRRQTDSSYIRLQQLLSALLRVAASRACSEGRLALTPSQIAQGDGLFLRALQNAAGRG